MQDNIHRISAIRNTRGNVSNAPTLASCNARFEAVPSKPPHVRSDSSYK